MRSINMNRQCSGHLELRAFVIVILLATGLAPLAHASNIPNVYKDAFEAIHPGQDPKWTNMQDVDSWFESERDLIEGVTLEWLRAPHDSAEWRRGLFFGRKIASKRICETLFESVRTGLARLADSNLPIREVDHEALGGPIVVLATCGDARAVPALHRLLSDARCPRRFLEGYLEAIRIIGDASSVGVIEGISRLKTDTSLDRKASLAEKVIEARLEGKDVFSDATSRLRDLNAQYVRALESGDYEGFASIQPFGFRAGVDAEEFKRKFKPTDPEIAEILRALKDVAGKEQFDIDRDEYRATLVVDGRFRFTYVLEVDGWKIHGPVRIAP